MPLVSVLMPAYNVSAYIDEAIVSILSQTQGDFELVILDDASSDDTAERISCYRDSRIRFYRNPSNTGIHTSRNLCLSHARGEFIAWMDADDRSLPDRLKVQTSYLLKHQDLVGVGSWAYIIDEAGQRIGELMFDIDPEQVRALLSSGNCIVNGSTMLRIAAVQKLGGYRPFPIAQDYDMWLRLTDHEPCLSNLPCFLYEYRRHPTSITQRCQAFYDVADYLIQLSSEHRRDGRPDPLEGLNTDNASHLLENTLRGQGKLGRQWIASQHWHSACRAHAQGKRLEHLSELVATLRWQPAYGPAWQALGNAVRRRLGLADLPPAKSVSGGGGAAV